MKWFRDNVTFGARLALLALAVQFVLSWGHTHVHAAPAGQVTSISAPVTDQGPHQHALGEPCEICAVMAMASTALFSEPPILKLPEATDFLALAIKAEFNHLGASHSAAQPRGPPAT
jgi:hypothetical protein